MTVIGYVVIRVDTPEPRLSSEHLLIEEDAREVVTFWNHRNTTGGIDPCRYTVAEVREIEEDGRA